MGQPNPRVNATHGQLWVNQGTCIARPSGATVGRMRYDTRCYFNVRSKADMSQLNLPHGTDNSTVEKEKNWKVKKTNVLRSIGKQFGEYVEC